MDAAIRFWCDALGGRVAVAAATRGGGYFDQLWGPGVSGRIAHLVFAAGSMELFEFPESAPVRPGTQTGDALLHFGVRVDDVPETLARVEAAGGSALLPVSHMLGDEANPRFVYCASPEGHVFELLEADHAEVVRLILAAVPDARP